MNTPFISASPRRPWQPAVLLALASVFAFQGQLVSAPADSIMAWGNNVNGQLGSGAFSSSSNVPVAVKTTGTPLAGKTIIAVSAGKTHSLALGGDGTLAAWGANDTFQLGKTSGSVDAPVAVTTAGTPLDGNVATAISAGGGHNLALCTDGTLVSWGSNASGELGNGTTTVGKTPKAVKTAGTPLAGKTIVGIFAGEDHNLALCSDGTLTAWGAGSLGQLGAGDTNPHSAAVAVTKTGTPLDGKTIIAISAGNHSSLALCSDSTLAAWGDNGVGELGNGTNPGTVAFSAVPVAVTTTGTPLAGKTIVAVSTGFNHCLALCSDGTLAAWGDNSLGELGNGSDPGTVPYSNVPVAVTTTGTPLAGKTIVAVSAVGRDCLALCSDGTLAAWGDNGLGELGNGSDPGTVPYSNVPVAVSTASLPAGTVFLRAAASSSATHNLALVGFAPNATAVVQKGDAAAGIAGAIFTSFGQPMINNSDRVAFVGTLEDGPGGVGTQKDTGIWADDSTGTRKLVAREGFAAFGTDGNFLTFSDPVYNNNEVVAFQATLKIALDQATATTNTGVWSTSTGVLALVAREGKQAPDCPTGATFKDLTALGLSDSGNVILFATLNDKAAPGVDATNDVGIWEGSSDPNLNLILRLGDSVGGKIVTAIDFLPKETAVTGQTRGFSATTGDLVFGAKFGDHTTGLVTVVTGAPQIAFVSGTAAPGGGGGNFLTFDAPAINTNDHLAFAAEMKTGASGVTAANNAGIWAEDGTGALQLIARASLAAPGTSGNFLTFNDPVYNNHEAVAFLAKLKVAQDQATADTASGVWCNSAGPLTLVARQGKQAPGCPTGATFAAFKQLALPDQGGATNQGGVLLLATLNVNSKAGVTAANDTGIWAVDTTGALRLIVRTGESTDIRTITGLSFLPAPDHVYGQTRSFAQGTGDLVYRAAFNNGSSGIFKVVFP